MINEHFLVSTSQRVNGLAQITRVEEIGGTEIPIVRVNFVKIGEVARFLNQKIDLCTVVYEVQDSRIIQCGNGTQSKKQRLLVLDDSMKVVPLDVWMNNVDKLSKDAAGTCVMLRGARVAQYNKKIYLNLPDNGVLDVTPDGNDDRVKFLKRWWDTDGCGSDFDALEDLE